MNLMRWYAGLFLITVAGCGTAAYTDRMEETVGGLGDAATVFGGLIEAPSDFVNLGREPTGIKFRMPAFMATPTYLQQGAAGEERLQESAVTVAEFNYAAEVMVAANGAEMPVYCYFGVPSKDDHTVDGVKTSMLAQTRGGSAAAWETIEVATPTGGTVTMEYMSLVSTQTFAGEEAEGRLDIYVYDGSPTHLMVIGWRAPLAVDDEINFFETARAAMGTVVVEDSS